jgi:2-hydroxychromene-2-carboxylate isomerase
MNRDGEYLLEFCRLAWSEGKDMRDTYNLKQAIENTSLSWSEARNFLDKDDWKVLIEKHREELIQSGLWGVPSFRLLDNNGNELFSSWGRDRLWLLSHEIKKHAKTRLAEG